MKNSNLFFSPSTSTLAVIGDSTLLAGLPGMNTTELASAMADMPPGIVDDISSVDEEDPKDKDFRLSKEMLAKKKKGSQFI